MWGGGKLHSPQSCFSTPCLILRVSGKRGADVLLQQGLAATLTAPPTGTHFVVTGTCPHVPRLWTFPSLNMTLAGRLPYLSRS